MEEPKKPINSSDVLKIRDCLVNNTGFTTTLISIIASKINMLVCNPELDNSDDQFAFRNMFMRNNSPIPVINRLDLIIEFYNFYLENNMNKTKLLAYVSGKFSEIRSTVPGVNETMIEPVKSLPVDSDDSLHVNDDEAVMDDLVISNNDGDANEPVAA